MLEFISQADLENTTRRQIATWYVIMTEEGWAEHAAWGDIEEKNSVTGP